jgi:D-serine deaminase-like pyridoxal phosphate-dependent protein
MTDYDHGADHGTSHQQQTGRPGWQFRDRLRIHPHHPACLLKAVESVEAVSGAQ